ncbi:MAG TPA: hypothetical protein IAB62_00995 [Candidatus Coprocola pullicola]|nr:hypothetical protein [Candidatus Coprocola pullicola]
MRLFRIVIVVAVLLLCIPRKVHATDFQNRSCSFSAFHCIIQIDKAV